MIQRCENPNNKDYNNYGGRGITVCDGWHTFDNFLADMSDCPDGLELDRIESNGHYTADNCRWTDEGTQAENRNWTRWVYIDDQKMPMKRAAELLGLKYGSLKHLTSKKGADMSAQDAISRLLVTRRS
jgi:hypothetical protein